MVKRDEQVEHGNSMESARAYMQHAVRVWERLARMDKVLERLSEDDQYVTRITLRPPTFERADWLAVVCSEGALGKLVGFHSAPDGLECIEGLVARLENKTLKWKEDQYADR